MRFAHPIPQAALPRPGCGRRLRGLPVFAKLIINNYGSIPGQPLRLKNTNKPDKSLSHILHQIEISDAL